MSHPRSPSSAGVGSGSSLTKHLSDRTLRTFLCTYGPISTHSTYSCKQLYIHTCLSFIIYAADSNFSGFSRCVSNDRFVFFRVKQSERNFLGMLTLQDEDITVFRNVGRRLTQTRRSFSAKRSLFCFKRNVIFTIDYPYEIHSTSECTQSLNTLEGISHRRAYYATIKYIQGPLTPLLIGLHDDHAEKCEALCEKETPGAPLAINF